jgi:hypothetical protein
MEAGKFLNLINKSLVMSIAEMKKEINAKVDRLNQHQLEMVEQFIEKINSVKGQEWDLKKYMDDILNERADVLEKLAQ